MTDTVDVTIPVSAETAAALLADPAARARAGALVSHHFASRDADAALLAEARALAKAAAAAPRAPYDGDRFAQRLDEVLRACQDEAARNGLTQEMVEEELRAHNAESRQAG